MKEEALRVIRCDQCHKRMSVSESALGGFGECLQCGKALRATESNTFPLPPGIAAPPGMIVSQLAEPVPTAPEAIVPESAEAPPPVAAARAKPPVNFHACGRCGRPFQGEWDVYETAEGRLCNICARRWRPQEEVQEEKLETSHQVHQTAEMINPTPLAPASQDPRPWKDGDGFEGRLEQYRFSPRRWAQQHHDTAWFIGAASAVVLLSLILPVEDWINYIFQSAENIDKVGDSPSWRLFFYIVKYGVDALEWFLTLFICLKICDRLPNEEFINNAVTIGVTALGLAFLNIFYINFFLFLILFVVQMAIIVELYQLSISQTLGFCVLLFLASKAGMLLTGFLLGISGSFL